jgi:16S rRNA (uracil1498-N3)-methyltransferase
MRTPRLFIRQPLAPQQVVVLDAAAAHYVGTVLRVKPGRDLIVFNGEGGEYLARVDQVTKKTVSLWIESFVDRDAESPLQIELGACLIKNDPMDWLIQKAVELGVTTISPLLSEFTDTKLPADKVEKKCVHWQQVVISACEQSGRTRIPVVNRPQPLMTWVDLVQAEYKCVLHPYQSQPFAVTKTPESLALLVGPEGGLSAAEFTYACGQEFIPLQLGPRILRAETAPLAALAIIQSVCGDL